MRIKLFVLGVQQYWSKYWLQERSHKLLVLWDFCKIPFNFISKYCKCLWWSNKEKWKPYFYYSREMSLHRCCWSEILHFLCKWTGKTFSNISSWILHHQQVCKVQGCHFFAFKYFIRSLVTGITATTLTYFFILMQLRIAE